MAVPESLSPIGSFVDDIEPFFARYAERYMASDVNAVGARYDAPMVAVREGRAIHLPNANAVREHLVGLMAAYAQSGATRADVAQIDPVSASGKVMGTSYWESQEAMDASEEAVRGPREEAARRGGASGAPAVEYYEVIIDTMDG